MKKFVVLLICTFCFLSAVTASEWGGLIRNTTYGKTRSFDDFGFKQTDSLFFWYATPISSSGFKFSAEGVYSFSFDNTSILTTDFSHVIDVDLFKFSKTVKKESFVFTMNFGRFNYSDASRVVFNQNMDGASVKFASKKNTYRIAAGYTGLLNERNVYILNSESVAYTPTNQIYALAYPFIMLDLGVDLNNLFAVQNLKFDVISFIDLGAEEKSRVYFETVLSGPVFKNFSYNLSFILETINFQEIAMYSAFNSIFSIGSNMYVKAGVEYASGKGESLTNFSGISSRTVCNSSTMRETTGLILPSVQYVYVGNDYYIGVIAKYLFNCLTDSVSADGFEFDVLYTYNIFTDLQLGLDLLTYTQTNSSIQNNSNYGLNLRLSFTF